MLDKANMPLKDKEKWKKILKIDVMSSEESDSDPSNDAMIVKPLEWRSAIVDRFLKKLDDKALEVKSPRAKRQRKLRITSSASSQRNPPSGVPNWAISQQT